MLRRRFGIGAGLLLALFVFTPLAHGQSGTRLYVDAAIQSPGDGTSWAAAYRHLQDALAYARNHTEITEIWVAKGTYMPDGGYIPPGGAPEYGPGSDVAFELVSGVAIYGGYPNGGGERDPAGNETILSGDLDGEGDSVDNSTYVVWAQSATANAILDGFSIEEAAGVGVNCDYSPSVALVRCTIRDNFSIGLAVFDATVNCMDCVFNSNQGGGARLDLGTLNLTNCLFMGNTAQFGGALVNMTGSAALTRCMLVGNIATGSGASGGAVYSDYSALTTLTSCMVVGNTATDSGGAVYTGGAVYSGYGYPSLTALTNCTLAANTAGNKGGAVDTGGDGVTTITNSILWGNTAASDPQISGNATVTYSCVHGTAVYAGEGNINYHPYFVAPLTGNYHLKGYSPCINAGDPNGNYSGQTDIDGDGRVLLGRVDMGADETTTRSQDSDSDGLWDDWELGQVCWAGQLATFDSDDNPDNDGLINLDEYHLGRDPCMPNEIPLLPEPGSWPYGIVGSTADSPFHSSPTLADVVPGDDGKMEILIGESTYNPDATLHCIFHDGNRAWTASPLDDEIRTSPGVSDLDHDGYKETIVGTTSGVTVAVYDHNGSTLWQFREFPRNGSAYCFYSSAAIADLVDDVGGESEFVMLSQNTGKVYCFDGNPVDGVDEGSPDPVSSEGKPYPAEARVSTVCGQSNDQVEARIQGQRVVWADMRSGNYDIYMYDFTEPVSDGTAICTELASQREPAVYGERIVWRDERIGQPGIYLSEPVEGVRQTYSISVGVNADDKVQPAIYADLVVWADKTSQADYDIRVYDLAVDTDQDGTPNYRDADRPSPDPAETTLCNATGNQERPAIYMKTVVWEDNRNYGTTGTDLYAKTLPNGQEQVVCQRPENQQRPSIFCGSKIVWEDYRTGNSDVYLAALQDGGWVEQSPLFAGPGDQKSPSIYGNNVVWFDANQQHFHIYNLRNGADTEVATVSVTSGTPSPVLWGTRVIYIDDPASDPNGKNVYTWGADYDILWVYETGVGGIYSSAAIGDANADGQPEVVFGHANGSVYCLKGNPPSGAGELVWSYATAGGAIEASPALADVDDDDNLEVFVGTASGRFVAVDGATGESQWEYTVGDAVISSVAVADLNNDDEYEVIFGSEDGYVYCLQADPVGSTGALLWRFDTQDPSGDPPRGAVTSSPAVFEYSGYRYVAVGCDNDYLYILDNQGSQVARFNANEDIDSSPTVADIDRDGYLEILFTGKTVTGQPCVWCVQVGDPAIVQPYATPGSRDWPKFRSQARNNGLLAATASNWRSVCYHGGPVSDDLAIPLDPAARCSAVVSETRRYGIQRIEVDFDTLLTRFDLVGTVNAVDTATGTNYPADQEIILTATGSTLVLDFTGGLPDGGLPDEQCYRIDLKDNILCLLDDTDCLVRGLAGDVNNDGSTNLTDMAFTKSKNGQPVLPDNIRFDVNLDGSINLTDMALVKSLNGHSAPCP